jgi:serine/threonine protein kinase
MCFICVHVLYMCRCGLYVYMCCICVHVFYMCTCVVYVHMYSFGCSGGQKAETEHTQKAKKSCNNWTGSLKLKNFTYKSSTPFDEGGSSKLYIGQHKVFGKVVIKGPKQDMEVINTEYGNMAKREARCLSRLRHPNIIQFFGLIWEPYCHALVLKFAANGNMFSFVRDNKLEMLLKVKLLCDASRGLHYLHCLPKTVIHGDVKAINVLITEDATAKLCDFGVAQWRSCTTHNPNTEVKPRGQTLTHSSPQRLENPALCSTEDDVYSFGILMWEVFSEEIPIFGLVNLVNNDNRPNNIKTILQPVPPKLVDLMTSCWNLRPEQRPNMLMTRNVLEECLFPGDIPAAVSKLLNHLKTKASSAAVADDDDDDDDDEGDVTGNPGHLHLYTLVVSKYFNFNFNSLVRNVTYKRYLYHIQRQDTATYYRSKTCMHINS